MNAGFYLGAFLVALGVLIVVHEFGHFLAARLCGVKVLRFCVGFGRPILSRRWGQDGTEWALAAFPLGGYVKMLDEREAAVAPEDVHRAFNRQSLSKRSLIVVAGPLANLILAVAIYFALFSHGVEELRPVVGTPVSQSQAARAGFLDGETIRSLDGVPVSSWQQLRWQILQKAASRDPVRLEVQGSAGDITVRELDLGQVTADEPENDPLTQLGLRPYRPPVPPVLGAVAKGSPAELAGMQAGDRLLSVDGKPLNDWRELVETVRASPGKAIQLRLRRGDVETLVQVVPTQEMEQGTAVGRIGVGSAGLSAAERQRLVITVRYPVPEALFQASRLTWETSIFSLKMMGRMVTGSVSWKNLSGPVTIADYAGQSARMGWTAYLKFLALISISLGVLNLLPIPLLDGGHLLYHTAEALRGKPLPDRVVELSQRLGLGVLAMLMVFALFNDISRLFSS